MARIMRKKVGDRQFRRTTIVLGLCVAFLAGVGFAKTGRLIDSSWWWLCLGPMLFLLRRRTAWTLLWVVLFGVTLGWWRGSLFQTKLMDYGRYYDRKVTITAVAKQDAAYNKYKQLSFDATSVVVQGGGQKLAGKISISGFGENAVFAGDRVSIRGDWASRSCTKRATIIR
jgi:hypothetical protein